MIIKEEKLEMAIEEAIKEFGNLEDELIFLVVHTDPSANNELIEYLKMINDTVTFAIDQIKELPTIIRKNGE